MKRRTVLVGLGGAVTAGLAGWAVLGSGSGKNYDVGMGDSVFNPETYTASVGDTVRWLNTSGRSHTVTAYDSGIPDGADFFASGGFDSTAAARKGWKNGEGAIYSSKAYEHTFETPGEFNYFCIPHERMGMVGKIVVEK